MSKHHEISEQRTGVPNACSNTDDGEVKPHSNVHTNVVVKRERLFSLLQEEHLKERLVARKTDKSAESQSAGVFRLYGAEPIPEVKPINAENDDQTSLGAVTHR